MRDLLLTVFNMSVTAGVVILFVLLARLLLKKSPKIFSYALWAVVLFRLLCPVSITTEFSLLGLLDAPVSETTEHTTAFEYVPQNVTYAPPAEATFPAVGNAAVDHIGTQQTIPEKVPGAAASSYINPLRVAAILWLTGIGAMTAYSVISLAMVRRRLIGAVHLRENIYLADYVESPFVMGWLRPKIYLPSALSEQEQGYIILHEQHHIRRGDHIIKALSFLALCIHWFNPLVWAAFILSGKDMEMSCDEAVVKKLGEGIRRDYSASLLSLATGRRIIAGTPLAFGEGDTKSRIKNMLRWKRAKPAVIFVSAAVVILALLVCGTNSTENDSWIKATQEAPNIKLEYHFAAPIHSYAIYEDIYENGELLSSKAIIFDDFQEEGGATARQATLSLNAQTLPSGENGFSGELSVYFEGAGAASLTRKLPKQHYTGAAYVPSESGTGISGRQKISTEDNITLLTILLSTEPNGETVVYAQNSTLAQSNDTVVIYRLVTSERKSAQYLKQIYVPASGETLETKEEASSVDDVRRKAEDISYHLELAAGMEFQAMDMAQQVGILAEYEDLLDDYTLIARESADGTAEYIVGCFNGDPAESPLHGMYGVELSSGTEELFQFLYQEEQSAVVEAVMAENKTDFPLSAGYRLEGSRILWSSNGETVLIQPRDTELQLDVPYNRYLYTPDGREYIVDAVSRGIDVCNRTDTYLYVYRIDQRFGEIAERIALTEAEAAAILAEKRVNILDGFGFAASLHTGSESTYYNEHSGIPQTVLDLAVERCDYRFGDPSYITDTVREAQLICDWLDEPVYAKAEDLPRLRKILKNAEQGYVGACGYGATLKLTFTGGEKLTVFKGCDGCDTIVFGSYGGYFLGEKENTEFWEMFGLDADTKLPIGYASQEN